MFEAYQHLKKEKLSPAQEQCRTLFLSLENAVSGEDKITKKRASNQASSILLPKVKQIGISRNKLHDSAQKLSVSKSIFNRNDYIDCGKTQSSFN
jgi:hypothetical protein